MRVIAALACFAIACTVQATADTRVIKTLGSARIEITSDGLWVSVRGQDYRVNVSRLPLIPSDCPQTGVNENCVQLWDGIAWDEPREVLYLAAAPHIGQNKQWMIFAYDLRSAQIKRIGDEAAEGLVAALFLHPAGIWPISGTTPAVPVARPPGWSSSTLRPATSAHSDFRQRTKASDPESSQSDGLGYRPYSTMRKSSMSPPAELAKKRRRRGRDRWGSRRYSIAADP